MYFQTLLNFIHFAFCYSIVLTLVCSNLNRNVNYSIEFLNLSPFLSSRQIHILYFDLQILASPGSKVLTLQNKRNIIFFETKEVCNAFDIICLYKYKYLRNMTM